MAGGVGLVLSGALAEFASTFASQSPASTSRATGLIITGVKSGNESWTLRPYGFHSTTSASAAALPPLLACSDSSEQLTATACANSGWSRPLLPDHAELAASEQAESDAARARRGGKPIRQVLSARFDMITHHWRRPADSIVSTSCFSADLPQLAYKVALP